MLNSIIFYGSLLDRPLKDDQKATTGHVLLYGAIEVHSHGKFGCIASNKTLAEETGLSPRTIKDYLTLLKSAGWIAYEVSKENHRGQILPLLELTPQTIQNVYPRRAPSATLDDTYRPIDNTIENIKDIATEVAPTLKEKEQTPQERKAALIEYVKSLSTSPRKDVALIGKYYLKYWNEYGFPNDLSVPAFREFNLSKKRFAQLKRIVALDIPDSRIESKLREGIQRNGDKFIFEFFISSLGR